MNKELLGKHIADYLAKRKTNSTVLAADLNERKERAAYYQSWTPERLAHMAAEEFGEYLSKLWAMRIWGNKQYVVDKLIADNGLPNLLTRISHQEHGTDEAPAKSAVQVRF